MRYADTSVTGAALTTSGSHVLPPMQWRGRFINANAVYFYTNTPTYLSLGNKSQFSDCRRIMINPTYGKNLLNVATGKYILCSNMVNYGDYTIRYAYFDFDETKIKILVNTTLHTWDFTKYSWQAGTNILLRLDSSGIPHLDSPMQLNLKNHTTETVADIGNDCVYVNAYRDANGNMVITDANFNYVSYRDGIFGLNDDFSWATTRAVATHHYALAEGEGDIVYDNIGNNDGKLITSSMSSARKTYTRIQSYNSLVGFKEDSNIETAISKAKIPMNKDLILYKSDFREDGIENIIATSKSITNDGKLLIQGTDSMFSVSIPLSFKITPVNVGRKLKLQFKIKNIGNLDINIDTLRILVGDTMEGGESCLSIKTNVNIPSNTELSFSEEFPPITTAIDQSCSIILTAQFVADINFKLEISDILLTQVDSMTSYPAVKNGKNKSEADISYSQLVSDLLPEVNGRWLIPNTWWKPMIQTSSNFGADDGDGWNITSTSRPTTLTVKNGWGVWSSNYVYYLKNHDTSDLPTDVSYGIDLKTNSYIGNSTSGYFLFNYYDTSTNKIWTEKLYKFKIKFSFWYKLNDLTTNNGELGVGICSNRLFWLENQDITDTNWHYVEKEEDVAIQSTITSIYHACLCFSWRGWRDGSTQSADIVDDTYYVGSLADVKYEITPVWDSYRPIYAKMDLDKKELSNILVYNMKQYGDNLTRIKNHVENF